jgi:uncharacterized membrane protein YgaE (UPF0421/DUF939 family)
MANAPQGRRIPERAAPLIDQAAERSRVSMRMRLDRVRVAWRSVVQAGLAAGAAYLIAHDVIGHARPFFAPVAAIITLGLTVAQRGRRAVELVIGVVVGIAVSDVVISGIGVGTWQLALVVMVTVAIALLVGRGQLLVNQAAVSAALVATLQPPSQGITFARAIDAMIGGSVALLVSGLILPQRPQATIRRSAWPVLDELAATLDDVAGALEARDVGRAEAALGRARAIDELTESFTEAVGVARETARFAPQRRRSRPYVETWADAAHQLDLAVRNVRVLARGAIRAIQLDENVPDEVARALRDLAAAVRAVDAALDDGGSLENVREPALRAAARATLVLARTGNLSVSVIVGQIRSTATDLLTGTGMDSDEAAEAVRRAAAAVEEEEEEEVQP